MKNSELATLLQRMHLAFYVRSFSLALNGLEIVMIPTPKITATQSYIAVPIMHVVARRLGCKSNIIF